MDVEDQFNFIEMSSESRDPDKKIVVREKKKVKKNLFIYSNGEGISKKHKNVSSWDSDSDIYRINCEYIISECSELLYSEEVWSRIYEDTGAISGNVFGIVVCVFCDRKDRIYDIKIESKDR